MCLVSLVISLILLAATLSSEKYKANAANARSMIEIESLNSFLKSVTDTKMYNQLIYDMRNGKRYEVFEEAQEILSDLSFMKNIRLESNCPSDCMLAKIAFMIERGKIPYFLSGCSGFRIHSLNNQPNTYNLTDDDLIELGIWIQSKLRKAGVSSAQVVFQKDRGKNIGELYWENAHRSEYSLSL